MATKKLKDLHIRTPKPLAPEDIRNNKAYEVEDILEIAWYNKLVDGKVVPTTEEDRAEIQEALKDRSTLTSRYLAAMSQRFLSKERVEANPEYYPVCTKERECTNNGIEGYIVTAAEAAQCHADKLLSESGIGYMAEYLSDTNTTEECKALLTLHTMYRTILSEGLMKKSELRAEMEDNLQKMGISKRRSTLLTRHYLQELI